MEQQSLLAPISDADLENFLKPKGKVAEIRDEFRQKADTKS